MRLQERKYDVRCFKQLKDDVADDSKQRVQLHPAAMSRFSHLKLFSDGTLHRTTKTRTCIFAHDPYTQETVVLDDAWPWAFLNINAGTVPSTLNDIILARLTDHCAACGAMRDGVAHWRGTALPINSFLDASTNIPDEPQMYLDLLPFMWHDATLTTVDQETQEYYTTAFHDAIHDDVGRSFSRAVSEPPPCLVRTSSYTQNDSADSAEGTLHTTTISFGADEASCRVAFHDHGGSIAAHIE